MSETVLTSLEYALLGLLDIAPMSGYDVSGIFARTPMAHYSSSPGTIYPALKRLERRGMVRTMLDRTNEARPRRVYEPTEAGQKALQGWLSQPATREEIIQNGSVSLLRFSLMEKHVSRDEVVEYLRGFRGLVEDYVADLERLATYAAGSQTLHQRLALDCGLRGYIGLKDWADVAIAQVERGFSANDGSVDR